MSGPLRRLDGSCESIGKYLALTRGVVARERLKHDVVSALRVRRAIPGTVECDEHALAIAFRELRFIVVGHPVRRPVSRKGRYRCGLGGAHAGFLAVSAIFGRENELVDERIEVAFRPAIVPALLQKHYLLRRKCRLLVRLVDVGPIRVQLVPAVLRYEQMTGGVEGEALAVADSRRVAFCRGKSLVRLISVVAPEAAARLKLLAGLFSR